jgi:hypothetical protein
MDEPKEFKAHRWLWLVSLTTIGILTSTAFLGMKNDGNNYFDIYSNSKVYKNHGTVKFTKLPVDLNDIKLIVPMGETDSGAKVDPKTGGGAHNTPSDHLSPAFFDPSKSHPTYAVADGTIVNVSYTKARWEPPVGQTKKLDDYSFTFQFTKNLFLQITHLTKVEPKLLQRLGTLSENVQNLRQIPIKAGTLLGMTGGSPILGTFDFWVIDMDSKLAPFVSPERYGEHSVDPFQYFVEPLRSQIYAKLPVRPEPRIGKYCFDIDGKLVGNWFSLGKNAVKKGQPALAFIYDNFDPSKILIGSAETGIVYVVAGNQPDPAKISKSSGLVKYELNDKNGRNPGTWVMLVQMLEKRKLRVEIFSNKPIDQVLAFDNMASDYDR